MQACMYFRYGMELQFFFNTQDRSGDTPYWKTLENYIIDNDPLQYGKHLLVLCVLVEVAPQDETVINNRPAMYVHS